jgi:hypothetical protein
MGSSLVTFAVGLGGVLVGAALVTLVPHASGAGSPATSSGKGSEARAAADAPSTGRSATEALLEAMRAQALAQAREPAPAAPPHPSPDAPPEAMDPVTLAKAEAALREEKLAIHALEARDATWAPKMERSLTSELTAFGEKQKFRPLSVECRSSSCVAELEYPTYAEAFAARVDLVANPYAAPCAREEFFDKPADPAAPFHAQVLFQCGNEEGRD